MSVDTVDQCLNSYKGLKYQGVAQEPDRLTVRYSFCEKRSFLTTLRGTEIVQNEEMLSAMSDLRAYLQQNNIPLHTNAPSTETEDPGLPNAVSPGERLCLVVPYVDLEYDANKQFKVLLYWHLVKER